MDSGPATDPDLLILSSLSSGAKHGYAIMQDIENFAGVSLGPGTLYAAITRLVEQGAIAADEPSGRQRPYRLTANGAEYLRAQLHKMRDLVTVGLRRLRTA